MRSKLLGSARCEVLPAGLQVGVRRRSPGPRERLGEVADGDRLEVREGARRDQLGPPDEDDVGLEPLELGEQRLDGRAGVEVHERGLDAAGRGLQRRVVEVLALADEGEPHGRHPRMLAAVRVCFLHPRCPRPPPIAEYARAARRASWPPPPRRRARSTSRSRPTGRRPPTCSRSTRSATSSGSTTSPTAAMGTWQAERFAAQLAYDLPVDFIAAAPWVRDALADLRPEARTVLVTSGAPRPRRDAPRRARPPRPPPPRPRPAGDGDERAALDRDGGAPRRGARSAARRRRA